MRRSWFASTVLTWPPCDPSAKDIEARIADVPGVVDAHASFQTDLPHVEVEPDVAKARQYGLKPGDIRRQASTLIASEEVSDIFAGGRAYDVHVTAIPSARDSVSDVENLLLDTPHGRRIKLKDVADVRVAPTPNAIQREKQSRYIDVSANVEGGDLAAVVDAVDDRVDGVIFPLGYHAEVLGEAAELDDARNRLLFFGLAAGLAIFLLLQAAFGSFRPALLTFLLLPTALVGGVIAVRLSDGVLSLGSLVGFLAVFGIAARNGILMISHFQRLESEGQAFGPDLVKLGAQQRLAPIMMTALATGLALVPLVVAGTIPGHEIEHPMAVVILGGLVTSTLLNLFVLPSLYLRFGKSRKYHRMPAAPTEAPCLPGARAYPKAPGRTCTQRSGDASERHAGLHCKRLTTDRSGHLVLRCRGWLREGTPMSDAVDTPNDRADPAPATTAPSTSGSVPSPRTAETSWLGRRSSSAG